MATPAPAQNPAQIVFNTGRLYTAAGQRIAARIVADVVLFVDVDRGIQGAFVGTDAAQIIEAAAGGRFGFQSAVMAAYDRTLYEWEGIDVYPIISALKAAALAL